MNEGFAEWGAKNGLPTRKQYTPTDAGRAECFVDRYGHMIKFVPGWGRWLLWTGQYWNKDEDGGIVRLAIDLHRKALHDAAELRDDRARSEAVKEAMTWGDAHMIKRMLDLAKCDCRVVTSHRDFDADPFLLGVRNGVIELRTGGFRAAAPADLITKQAGSEFDATATCPRWVKFLDKVLASDAELIGYVQRFVGYTLTGDVSAQCFPFLYGSGKNGKSVFTETLQTLLGDYAQRAPQSLLTASNNGREPSQEVARLQGARLVVGSETEEGARLAESRVKDITGGDTLTGRYLYQEAFDFRPCLKLWMFGNHKPEIRGTDEGIWRRMRLIPFTVQIREEERDVNLPTALRHELPGILRWALEGTRNWILEGGLRTPHLVVVASDEYRQDEDSLAEFIQAELVREADARAPTKEVFERYRKWAVEVGNRFPLNQRTLTKRLKERGYESGHHSTGNFFRGLTLK